MNDTLREPWHLMILACLCAAGDSGITTAKIRSAVKPWLDGTRAAEQDAMLRPVLDTLAQHDYCTVRTKGKTATWTATPTGMEMTRQALGLTASSPMPKWTEMISGPLSILAVGASPGDEVERKQIASKEGLSALLLHRTHDLPVPVFSKKKQCVDALLWKQLGRTDSRPFSLEEVKRHLLAPLLGLKPGRLSSTQLVALLTAKTVGARNTSPKALRDALLGQWLSSSKRDNTAVRGADVQGDFAAVALNVARQTAEGRFGEDLVFIHSVHATWQATQSARACSLETFKERLVDAYRRGFLELVRADLVSEMPHDDVAQSETRYLNAVFHLIRLPHRGVHPHAEPTR